jgi:hypothetical protein
MTRPRRYCVRTATAIHRDLSAEDALESMRVWWTERHQLLPAVDTDALQDDIDRHAEVPDPDVASLAELQQYARDVSRIARAYLPPPRGAAHRLRVHLDRP